MHQDPMLQFFEYAHLPEALREVSRPFCELAHSVVEKLPSNPERTVALRKLLEAKDSAVRSTIYKFQERPPTIDKLERGATCPAPNMRVGEVAK